jgi:competence protein ComEC
MFRGDTNLFTEGVAHQLPPETCPDTIPHQPVEHLDDFSGDDRYINYRNKRILLLDQPVSFAPAPGKPRVDLLVLSKNPKLYMKKLAASLDIRQVVFDGSVPAWKMDHWKKDCDSLQIPWHDVTTKGAFVMNLN